MRDVTRSVSFYEKLGFTALVEWPGYAKLTAENGAIVHLAAEGTAPPDRPTIPLSAPDSTAASALSIIVLEVEDCRQTRAELRAAGIDLLTEPAVPAWGGEVRAFLRDPDGHLIEINEPTGDTSAH